MALSDAFMTLLTAYGGQAAANHPSRETFYNLAVATVNTSAWGSLATDALALVTAHFCLAMPANSDDMQRAIVASEPVGGMGTGNRSYTTTNVFPDDEWMSTAPGRRYLNLRRSLLGVGTPRVF